jgi:hypothetical protein
MIVVQNAYGVTLGNVVDEIWQTWLPRNVGLVPDDRTCPSHQYLKYTRKSCCCYNTTKEIESEHNEDMVTLELERAKKQLKLISIEALARRMEKETAMRRKEAEKEHEEADIEKDSGGGRLRDARGSFRKKDH